MPIKPEHFDELLAGYEKPEDLLGEDGLFKQLKKALLERALGAELTHHLGYEKGDPAGRGTGNNRNGTYPKTVLTEDRSVEIEVPRDRNGSFEPQIVAKGETRLDGFDDKIISLYARGMTVLDPGPPARTLCRRGLARPDQPGHRGRAGRGSRLAEQAARHGLSGGVLRRLAGQDPRRERGQEQGRLPGPCAGLRRS
jgi:hypothetical protein